VNKAKKKDRSLEKPRLATVRAPVPSILPAGNTPRKYYVVHETVPSEQCGLEAAPIGKCHPTVGSSPGDQRAFLAIIDTYVTRL
jgi:hypothetical protein